MRLALLLVVASVLIARPAASCPPPPPGEICSKYADRRERVAPAPAPTVTYVRAGKRKPPKGRAKLVRHLTSGTWRAFEDDSIAPLQLFDGSNIPDVVDLAEGSRSVIIHGVTKAKRLYRIEMDGHVFEVRTCLVARRTTSCLVPLD
jgi:hypothetical protein